MKRDGFTLMELVVVMVLLGILSVYVASRFDNRGLGVHAAAKELVEAIRYAQQRSMSNTGAARFYIAIDHSGYRVSQGGRDVANPLTGNPPYVDDNWASRGIGTGTRATIEFDGRGEPLDRATGASPGLLAITLSERSGATATVILQPVTGYVRVR